MNELSLMQTKIASEATALIAKRLAELITIEDFDCETIKKFIIQICGIMIEFNATLTDENVERIKNTAISLRKKNEKTKNKVA